MREWTERHIIELIHKLWDNLKKDLKSGLSDLTGVKLRLYTNLYSHVELPIAGYNGLMSRLIIKQFPYNATTKSKSGLVTTTQGHGTVIKLSFQDR